MFSFDKIFFVSVLLEFQKKIEQIVNFDFMWWNMVCMHGGILLSSVNSSHDGRIAIITQIEVEYNEKKPNNRKLDRVLSAAMTVTNFQELILIVKTSWSDVCLLVLHNTLEEWYDSRSPIYIHQSKLWSKGDVDCHSKHHLTTILCSIIAVTV